MTKKAIATVGFALPDEKIEFIEMASRRSLLEFDIILFRPEFDYHRSSTYRGHDCYDDYQSARINEEIAHWRTQIGTAAVAGKTILIFLPTKRAFYVDTGTRQYSGTGKNA